MPVLRTPLYPLTDGAADDDRRRLVFDAEARRLFVGHESRRGEMRGSGYGIETEEMDVGPFLEQSGQGQHQLVWLLGSQFEARENAARA